ncbi:MAG: ABC transporter ATP-binding protein [Bacteroidota bacterium]
MKNAKITASSLLDTTVLRKLLMFVKPYRSIFYLLILLTVLAGVLGPLQPYLIQVTIDRYMSKGDYTGLVHMTLLLVGLLIAQVIVQYFSTYLADWLGQHIVSDVRVKIYAHVARLKADFLNHTSVGKLVARTITDTSNLLEVFSQGMAALLGDLLQVTAMVGLMLYTNWRLTLVSLATFPLLGVLTYIFKEKNKQVYNKIVKAATALSVFVQSHIVGMTVIQAFGQERQEAEKFEGLNAAHRDANIKSVLYYALYFPSIAVINSASISLLIWYGAKGVIQCTSTFGELVAFLMYIQLLFRPLHLIADRFNTLQLGIVSTEKIFQLLENGEQALDEGTYHLARLQGTIDFKNVWFAYEEGHYILEDVSFHVAAKQSLAIVGATGAGKSTMLHLLERSYDPEQGDICIDGVPIKNYTLQALRQNIGLVLQDVFLFSDSIYNNITLGDSTIPRRRVEEAARLIGLHDLVVRLPGGYDYNVMERGMTLSMGQRQLLAFARVLVYNPCILMLDEATASMDTETEELVQRATTTLMQDRTCIIIAHRLSTVQHADHILVLDRGRVREEGTHQALLAQGGIYAGLYQAAG